jgi:hypothetical protein
MAFDFAIFGSSPLSMLLGGLLATAHGRTVCVIGDAWSPWPLPHRLDAAWLTATRPESWAMLKAGSAETVKLINGIGKGLVEHVDPLLIAETPASLEAIAHMRASAVGLGYAMERVADRSLAQSGAAFHLRDVASLVRGKAEPAISAWLDRSGARRWAREDGQITIRRDGTVRIKSFGREFDANRAILADDAALLDWLDDAARDRLLRQAAARTVLTEPAKPIAAPLVRYLDRQVTIAQHGKSGITAIAAGAAEDSAARIGAALAPQAPLRRAADASFVQVETLDGAPLVAMARGTKTTVIAGFGDAAAFFAPALARHFVGKSTETEAQYFAAHDIGRGNARQLVADFVAELA